MRWWRIVVLVVMALALATGLVTYRSSRVWNAMVEAVDTRQAALDASTGERAVLFGDFLEGPAAAEYDRAVQLLAGVWSKLEGSRSAPDGVGELFDAWSIAPDEDLEAREKVIEQMRPAFVALRKGAHSRDARCRVAWRDGLFKLPSVAPMIAVADAVVLRAVFLIRTGEPGQQLEAVATVLDALQYGRDMVEDPRAIYSAIGVSTIDRVIDRVFLRDPQDEHFGERPTSLLPRLSKDALSLLSAGLRKLEARPMPGLRRTIEGEAVLVARSMQITTDPSAFVGGGVVPIAWRFGFSSSWMVGDAVLSMLDSAAGVAAESRPWSEVKPMLDSYVAGLMEAKNPLVRVLQPNLSGLEKGRRQTVARIRMLRMAVAELLGGMVDAPDPFGGYINSEILGGIVRYWSAGPDGQDDGGTDPKLDFVRLR